MRRRVSFPLVVFVSACGAFGEGNGNDGAPVSASRSIPCGDENCAGESVCCLDGTGDTKCATTTCAERTFVCNDSADCSEGRVCCVDVVVNDPNNAMVEGSTCRAAADCQESTSETGPTKMRGCDPRGGDCGSKDCVELKGGRYPTVFPASHVWVCGK